MATPFSPQFLYYMEISACTTIALPKRALIRMKMRVIPSSNCYYILIMGKCENYFAVPPESNIIVTRNKHVEELWPISKWTQMLTDGKLGNTNISLSLANRLIDRW